MAGEEGWTMALNLEGFEVVQAEVERKQRQVRLTVLPQWPVAVCPHCGQGRTQVHQTRDLAGVHDLPLADQAVELCVRVSQFWCADCQRAFTPLDDAEARPALWQVFTADLDPDDLGDSCALAAAVIEERPDPHRRMILLPEDDE